MKPPLGPSLLFATTALLLAGCDPESRDQQATHARRGGFTPAHHEPVPSGEGGDQGPGDAAPEMAHVDHHERAPQNPDVAPPPEKKAPAASVGNPEYGKAVPGKPGFVTSPYAPGQGYVDVRGYAPGTEVKDPYSGKIFLVPAQ